MPTDQMQMPTLPQEPSLTTEPHVESILHTLPVTSVESESAERVSEKFLLDSISEKEPQESSALSRILEFMQALVLGAAVLGSGWLAVKALLTAFTSR